MKVREESEKGALKLNIQRTNIMASGPITSWQINGETVETVSDFTFLGFTITADGYCSHEIKRLLGGGFRMGNTSTMADFIFLDSKITADGECSHEMLLLGRKAMINLDSILKSRDITSPTKVCIVKAMIFPVVMYECESWTVAEC